MRYLKLFMGMNFVMKFGLIEQGDDPRKFLQKYPGIQTNLKNLELY